MASQIRGSHAGNPLRDSDRPKVFSIFFRLVLVLGVAWVLFSSALFIYVATSGNDSHYVFEPSEEMLENWSEFSDCERELSGKYWSDDSPESFAEMAELLFAVQAECEEKTGHSFSLDQQDRIKEYLGHKRPPDTQSWVGRYLAPLGIVLAGPALLFGVLYLVRWIIVGSKNRAADHS